MISILFFAMASIKLSSGELTLNFKCVISSRKVFYVTYKQHYCHSVEFALSTCVSGALYIKWLTICNLAQHVWTWLGLGAFCGSNECSSWWRAFNLTTLLILPTCICCSYKFPHTTPPTYYLYSSTAWTIKAAKLWYQSFELLYTYCTICEKLTFCKLDYYNIWQYIFQI